MTVPKRVGEALRRRRMALRMKQADIATQLGTTRAYVSAIERGVDWDPDAEKLVIWARALGWQDDEILTQLGRHGVPGEVVTRLSPDVVDAIGQAIAAGIRDGWAEVMQMLREEPTGEAPPDEPGESISQ